MIPPAILIIILILTVTTWIVLWVSRRFAYAFDIKIRDGRAALQSGQPPRSSFLVDVQEIAQRNGIRRGNVRGVRSGRAIRLTFSGPISVEARQQMRNAWSVLR